MFCKNCGAKLPEQGAYCTQCGSGSQVQVNTTTEDTPNWPVNILTLCCIPLLGLVMYFVWKHEKPAAAKSALTFFFINIGLCILVYVLLFIFGFIAYLNVEEV